MPTVIISGSNGYFGGIACEYFREKGWDVLKASRQADANIQIELDHPEGFAEKKIESHADLFIHAAAAHEVTCREQPYRSIFQNVAGTRAALEFCVSNQIKKFIYISTFHVFGEPKGVIDEATFPAPTNDYGLSHLQAEDYVRMYIRQNKIEGMVVRPSNFFGIPSNVDKCNRWTLVPLAFCRDAVENGKIELKTSGTQKRNFVSVRDICAVINSTINEIVKFPLLHVCGEDTISIRDLAFIVQKVLGNMGKSVQLIIPDREVTNDNEFTYISKLLKESLKPKEKIEFFILEFCKMLLRNSKKSKTN